MGRISFGRIAAGLSLGCALVVTSLVVRREISGESAVFAPRGIGDYQPILVSGWDSLVSKGHRFGPDSATVTILEFADFQCPACRRFTEVALRPLLEEFPSDLSVVFRHWPLPYHQHAYQAARASECADGQGRFREFHDALYEFQDSLGIITFQAFGRIAGLADLASFETCLSRTDSLPEISEDIATVKRLGGRGTPTVIVNGQLLNGVPDSAGLAAIVRRIRQKAGE